MGRHWNTSGQNCIIIKASFPWLGGLTGVIINIGVECSGVLLTVLLRGPRWDWNILTVLPALVSPWFVDDICSSGASATPLSQYQICPAVTVTWRGGEMSPAQNDPISVIRKPAEVLFVFPTHKYSVSGGEWCYHCKLLSEQYHQDSDSRTKSSLVDYWMLDNLIRFIFSPFVSSQYLGRCPCPALCSQILLINQVDNGTPGLWGSVTVSHQYSLPPNILAGWQRSL